MSFVNKFAWSGLAVVLALVLSMGLMVQTAHAAVITDATGTANQIAREVQNSGTTGAQTWKLGGNIVISEGPTAWAAGDTITLTHTGITASTVVASAACTGVGGAGTTVITITATITAGASNDTCTITSIVAKATADEAAGTVHNVTLPNATIVATITSRQLLLGWAPTSTCASPIDTTTPTTTADPNASGFGLCSVAGNQTSGAVQAALPITYTVSVGYVSTGTSKSTVSLTNASGLSVTTYRGAGNVATTDTAIASNSSINGVSTLPITLTAATGTTASKMTFASCQNLAIAPTVTNATPGYVSPQVGSYCSLQVQDSTGLGVNSQTVLISVDKGAIVAGQTTTCVGGGNTSKSITATSSTSSATPGATTTAGTIAFTVCGNQTDAAGKITVTANNVSTTMANATTSLTQAGRPAKITAVVTGGNTVTVTVVDAGGNPVADGTPVRYTISSNAGAVSSSCVTTTNGTATAVVALNQATGTVIVSTDWNETGSSASSCAAAATTNVTSTWVASTGSQSLSSAVSLPGGGTTTPPPPAQGCPTAAANNTAPKGGGGFGFLTGYCGPVSGIGAALACTTLNGAVYFPVGLDFISYVVNSSVAAVNAAFIAYFPNGIPAGTTFLSRC